MPDQHKSTLEEQYIRTLAWLNQDPHNELLLKDSFHCALRAHRFSEANDLLSRIKTSLTFEPIAVKFSEIDLMLAESNFEGALEYLRDIVGLPESSSQTSSEQIGTYRAYAYARLGRHAEAKATLEPFCIPLETTTPSEPAMRYWLNSAHHLGFVDEALAAINVWHSRGVLPPDLFGVASLLALDCNDRVSAKKWCDRAVSVGMDSKALVARSTLKLGEHDASSALSDAEEALVLAPNDGRAWSGRAFCQLALGLLNEARHSFDRAIELQPEHIGTLHGRAWLNIIEGDLAAAESDLQAALELDRNFAESHGGMAVVKALQGKRDEAHACMEKARRLPRGSAAAGFAQLVLEGKLSDKAAFTTFVGQIVLGSNNDAIDRA